VARTAAAKGSLLFETLPVSVVLAAIAQTCRPPHSLLGGGKTSGPAPYRCAEKVIESACVINTASASYAISEEER
jgi:hypothetical protein